MTETLTLTKTPVPEFARRVYDDVDQQSFGDAFDKFFTFADGVSS